MRSFRRTTVIGVLALMLLLVGCGQKPSGPSSATPASEVVTVELRNMQFQPKTLTVMAGATVTFVNRDPGLHNVVQINAKRVGKEEPGFSSPRLEKNQRWSVTFENPGTYPIVCTVGAHHTAGMVATITVVP